jgi:hypothetical protein
MGWSAQRWLSQELDYLHIVRKDCTGLEGASTLE